MKHSMGDAVIVVVLLVFAVAWVTLWFVTLRASGSDGDDGSLLLFALIFGPPLWAGYCADGIIRR